MAGNPTTPLPTVRVLWRPEQFTRVSNGTFETNTTGWATTAGINAAATSITRITSDFHSGAACALVVCTATDTSGVNFDMGTNRFYDEGSYGSVYVATGWVKRVSGSKRLRVTLGSLGTSSDRATLTITDLLDSWQPFVIRWLPSANRTDVELAVTNGSAEALTFRLDDVAVYSVDAFSQVENGWFPVDTTGWNIAGTGSIALAATSLTHTTTDGFAPMSQTCAELLTTTTSGSGAEYALGNRKFTSGRTYRFRVALKRKASGLAGTAKLTFGSLGTAGDRATATVTTANVGNVWEWFTVDWTPSADRTDAAIAITNSAANSTNPYIDHCEVYEALDDIGEDVETLRWDRKLDAIGTISASVRDADGEYHPRNTSAALYGSLAPGKRIWARAVYNSTLYPMFFGTLTTIEPPALGGLHTDFIAEDAFADFERADVSLDFAQDDSYRTVRGFIVDSVVSAQPSAVSAPTASARRLRSYGIEGNNHYRGTDGDVSALGLLADLNDATGTVHHMRPHVKANVGWRYYTIDRATLTENRTDFTVDEDFEDLTSVRFTHEALENRQDVPWQGYETLPPPGADESGFGEVVLAFDPDVYGTDGSNDEPYLKYTLDEYGTDDNHPEPRWRYPEGISRARWHRRRKRGLKVPRRTRVYPDALVPFTMAANEVRRFVIDFAIPISGPVVSFAGSANVVSRLVEQRPQRVIVDLYATALATIDRVSVNGTPWLPLDDLTETANDFESQAAHGTHTGPTLSTAYIPSRAAAEGIGRYRNWRWAAPRLRPTLHLGLAQVATAVDVNPADHITLSADRWRIDALSFLVLSGTWEVKSGGLEWTCQLDLEELPTHTDWLTLDHATLGLDEAVVLAY